MASRPNDPGKVMKHHFRIKNENKNMTSQEKFIKEKTSPLPSLECTSCKSMKIEKVHHCSKC